MTYKMLVRDIREEYQPQIEEMTRRLAEKDREIECLRTALRAELKEDM